MARARVRWEGYRHRVASLTPVGESNSGGMGHSVLVLRGVMVLALLDLNAAVIGRCIGRRSGWWDVDEFEWSPRLQQAWPAMCEEISAHVERRTIPSTAELNGLVLDDGRTTDSIPDGEGMWRVLLLRSFGREVRANTQHFPATMAALEGVPVLANVGFSCLDPGSRIDEHRDPNRGALRYQLPLLIPEPVGSCRITVAAEQRVWEPGQPVLFDLHEPHHTANEGTGPRVLLMFEILMPLPFGPSVLNRLAQWSYRMLPTYRGITTRADRLATPA